MGIPRQKQESDKTRKSALKPVKTRPEKSKSSRKSKQKKRISDESVTSRQTGCTNCQTVFEVSAELLATSDTRVRCGECLTIFDARTNLRDSSHHDDSIASSAEIVDTPTDSDSVKAESDLIIDQLMTNTSSLPKAAAIAALASDTSSMGGTYSDFDLFSSDTALPEVHFFDNTRDSPDFQFDDISDLGDVTFSDTLFAGDVTVDASSVLNAHLESLTSSSISLGGSVEFVEGDTDHDPLVFNYRETRPESDLKIKETGQRSDAFEAELPIVEPVVFNAKGVTNNSLDVPSPVSSSWLLRIGLSVLVFIIAGSLYGYREREKLLNNSSLRPLLSSACGLLSCKLPEQVDLAALRAVDRSVVLHPTVTSALIIKFGIVNTADFRQSYPILEIRLTNRAGRLVVRNRFSPGEYLADWQPGDVLTVGERLDIGLAVEDPGNTATSFELDFHEVK